MNSKSCKWVNRCAWSFHYDMVESYYIIIINPAETTISKDSTWIFSHPSLSSCIDLHNHDKISHTIAYRRASQVPPYFWITNVCISECTGLAMNIWTIVSPWSAHIALLYNHICHKQIILNFYDIWWFRNIKLKSMKGDYPYFNRPHVWKWRIHVLIPLLGLGRGLEGWRKKFHPNIPYFAFKSVAGMRAMQVDYSADLFSPLSLSWCVGGDRDKMDDECGEGTDQEEIEIEGG